jgi:5-methylcytosine-specific restriction endonuclease McrA
MIKNKACKTCKLNKPVSEFGKHSMSKDRLRPDCRPCHREKSKAWNAANKDKCTAARKRFAAANRKRCCEYVKAYVKRNPEKVRASRKKRYEETKHILKERYYSPEKQRVASARRRAKMKNVGGTWNMTDARRILKAQKGRCAICKSGLKKHYHVDHIHPLHRGGSNYPRNLQILCKGCNLRKSHKDPIDFSRELGLLC